MESSPNLPEEHRENLSIIKQSSEDLQRIVTAVLDWSKLDAGSIQAESIEFDLRSVVEGATVTVAHIAQAKSVEIVLETPVTADPLWTLLGDPHRLRQCLLNLLSNALKFTPVAQGGIKPTIRIRWVLDERTNGVDVTIVVQDEGIGIPRRAMNKLFGAFTQADVGTARKYGGSGLGTSWR
jgi:two-component system sensor histidine kinase/response regulator